MKTIGLVGGMTPELTKFYSVILGCTELPLVISSEDLPIQVLGTAAIHIDAILAAAA